MVRRLFGCKHVGYLDSMVRRIDGKIVCPCNRCGKLLVADYGLALGCSWEEKPPNAKLTDRPE